ncbi:hypothetical protein SLE2022_027930 [Rubroshorea leprosula]
MIWQYFFASFLSRDEAFKLINDGWEQHSNGAEAAIEQQESIFESSIQENGFVAIEKVNSFKCPIDELDTADRDKAASTSSAAQFSPNVENDLEVENDLDLPINTDPSSSLDTCIWKPENFDAPKGVGVILCIEKALAQSGVSREDVNYINADATSTPAGDIKEFQALIHCFGRNPELRVNSTKSMIGHLLGAAGAMEAVAAVQHDLVFFAGNTNRVGSSKY